MRFLEMELEIMNLSFLNAQFSSSVKEGVTKVKL